MKNRLGMSLLEMLVSLTTLGILTSVATLAARSMKDVRDPSRAMVEDSLTAAIAQGRTITIEAQRDGHTISATVLPDGRVLADSGWNADHRSSMHAR